MTRNPILDELYEAREEILAEHGGDVSAYLRDAEKRLAASGRPIAKIKQRTIRCTGATKPGELPMENRLSSPSELGR